MPRRRRAPLIGAALALCAVAVAAMQGGSGLDETAGPGSEPTPTDRIEIPIGRDVRPRTPAPDVPVDATTTTTTVLRADRSGGVAPSPSAAPSSTRRPPSTSPTTAPPVDDTPVLLAVDAPAPAVRPRPTGGAAVARQRFVTIDAKATVDQLMGARAEAVPGGFRRTGRPIKLRLFDEPPIKLDPVAPYVKESTGGPVANGSAALLTTYSWLGTTPSSPTVTASLTVTQDSAGTFQLTGTITTSADGPPLQLDHVDADRYALTQLTTGIPCQPEVVGTSGELTTTVAPTTTTTDPACAR